MHKLNYFILDRSLGQWYSNGNWYDSILYATPFMTKDGAQLVVDSLPFPESYEVVAIHFKGH